MGPGSPPRLPDRDLLGAMDRAMLRPMRKDRIMAVDRTIEGDVRRTVQKAVYRVVLVDWGVCLAVEEGVRR